MARWQPLRTDVLDSLAAEILHNYGRGRALVAVDGPSGSGTARFADDLAAAVIRAGHAAVRASVERFRRKPGADASAESFYSEGHDYALFREVLAEPFRRGAERVGTVPAGTGADAASATAPGDALLIVDGVFLNRPELAGLWNYSVWLDVPGSADAAGGGTALVDGSDPGQAAGLRYRAEAHPRRSATAIIDLHDADHPRRVFADSC